MENVDITEIKFTTGRENPPLYSNSKCSKYEFSARLLSCVYKHKISWDATDEILKLFQLVAPTPNSIPSSSRIMRNLFNIGSSLAQIYYYCPDPNCLDYIGQLPDNNIKKVECLKCHNRFTPTLKCSFVYLPIRQQLIEYFQNKSIKEAVILNLNQRLRNGPQNEREQQLCNELNTSVFLSVTLNTDGFIVYKSIGESCWVILLILNELPYRLKISTFILSTLWFGSK